MFEIFDDGYTELVAPRQRFRLEIPHSSRSRNAVYPDLPDHITPGWHELWRLGWRRRAGPGWGWRYWRGSDVKINPYRVRAAIVEIYTGTLAARNAVDGTSKTIRQGDIILQDEIHVNGQSGVVQRRSGVLRFYSAKLVGHESEYMTVAMYEGDGAKEKIRILPWVSPNTIPEA
ncbi:hypothetical protein B0H14DRAFT_2576302 [Mycena olivaceomarginata]|nr:hypothetical protein B0H14DRAFT_2576302 [Mycena olivaceomarginata]